MSFVTRRVLLFLSTAMAIVLLLVAGFVWSGTYNVGADDPHWRPTHALLETVRHRSIDTRASKLQVPTDLGDPARIQQGAGNYDAMCTGCHLAPGMAETELSKGLYPAPPNLTRATVDATHAFWVIKHGIKASGMPAWGKSMEDAYIWNMAAFLQQLPKLNAEQYQGLVASSGGHSHGGGETRPHGRDQGEPDDHGVTGGMPMDGESKPHAHPPGTTPHEDMPKPRPRAHPPGTPPHDDAPQPGAKPHAHAAGTPPHSDAAPVEPAATRPSTEDAPPAAPASAEQGAHDEHDHQH